MAKTLNQLASKTIEAIMRKTYQGAMVRHDGGGLYLTVRPSGGGWWSYCYKSNGKERELGIGPLADWPAPEARSKAQAYRDLRRAGRDPMAETHIAEAKQDIETAQAVALLQTFDDEATIWIDAQRAAGITSQTIKNFERYQRRARECGIGAMVLDSILSQHIADLLKPWTADERKRSRQFFRNVFKQAKAAGRSALTLANPVDNLDSLLPKISKAKQAELADADDLGGVDEALPWQEVPELVAKLVALSETHTTAHALLMVVLSGLRAQEVTKTEPREFNMAKGEWNKPASHMKTKKAHVVPISSGIARVFQAMQAADSKWLFPGLKGQHIDGGSLRKLLQDDLGYKGRTVRGLRRTLRNWGGEIIDGRNRFANDAMECCLAHKVANGVAGHYYTLTHYTERQKILEAWAAYCFSAVAPSNVVQLREAA